MGEIITFYSYKGGTGRSMAMANVAWILASRKKRVLMIDWDLEAPGLHRYFAPFLVDRDLSASRGVIDFIRDFAVRAATPPTEGEALKPDWYLPLADIGDYAVSIRWPHFAPGMLDFIPAGQQDASYATRVNSFNWDTFYDRLGGGPFLEAAKKSIRDQYDYILIDSRTGVSDTSGICTVQMPDTVVVCFTLNNQSIKGASGVARSIATQRTDGAGKRRVRILPVATRVDTFEKEKLDKRRAFAREVFHDFLDVLPDSYWNDVEIPYWSFYAYEECLATFGDEPGAKHSMLPAFEAIASYVTNGDVRSVVPPSPETRRDVLAAFAETEAQRSDSGPITGTFPSTAGGSDAPAHDLYLSFHQLDQRDGETLIELLQGRRLSDVIDSRQAPHGPDWAQAIEHNLKNSRAFAFCEGRYGLSSWQKRELAFALAYQKKEAESGRWYPVVPILLPQSTVQGSGSWIYFSGLDLRRKVDDAPALDGFARSLLGGEFARFPSGANPYRGNGHYAERDATLFFGRSSEVQRLAELVERSPVVFLSGPSGSGKSSLLNAGLLPYLRRQAPPATVWEIVRFRPGATPFTALVAKLVALWSTEASETIRALEVSTMASRMANEGISLHSVVPLALERAPRASRLLIVVDQVEELFLQVRPDQWSRFLEMLQAVTQRAPVTVLFAVRPEWEDSIRDLMPQWRWLLQDAFVIDAMKDEQLREVIVKPAKFAGAKAPPADPDTLIEAVTGEPGSLAIVSRQLHRAWALGEGTPDVGSLLTKTMESHFAVLPELERNTLLSVVSRLVNV